MVAGGAIVGATWPVLVPGVSVDAEILGGAAVGSGVALVALRRMIRPARPGRAQEVVPPVVAPRSLLALILMGVGGFVVVLGLLGLALVVMFLGSAEGKAAGHQLPKLRVASSN